ncbi:Growth hormone-regulated TBC protein 1-A [Frankliniella fusca]|uniref:Growth hormone-regulated TBC protein 1 n=1 Tax=Frankliniella fusca TaxID=407009 RepID=A0AAE1HKD8_9NEOP|nr:Growth hormone-regulated TBC protein 1-A [Frankliniella fusca]
MAKSSFSKVDEYGFERGDDFNYEAYEEFMSEYLPVLARRSRKWARLMINPTSLKRGPLIKRYMRKGVPAEHRSQVWLWASGAAQLREKMGPNLYRELLDEPHDDEVVSSICVDLPRTFPDNIFFNQSDQSELRNQLFRVLCAYAHHNKRVGYCQGLNYIAGLLLLVTKSEENSFWLLKILVEQILPDYYGPTMEGVVVDIDVLGELVRLKAPAIHRQVSDLGLPWPVVTTKWFICLFAEVLPVETVLRIWDCLFYEGSKIIFRVCLTLIKNQTSTLLTCDDFGSLASAFKSLTNDSSTLHCHPFMKSIFQVPGPLSTATIIRLREKISQERHKS